MNVLSVLFSVLILCLIVTAHELGHFLVGKACGIGVIEFSVGFGPKILQWRGRETLYSIRCIPLGGYCRFVGEDGEDPAPNAMNNQPVWKRFLTVLAGPVMNFVLGTVLVVVLFLGFGLEYPVPVVGELVPGMPAETYGMLPGDILVQVDGQPIENNEYGTGQATAALQNSDKSRPVEIVVLRDGEEVTLQVPLQKTGDGNYQVGIFFAYRSFRYPLGETLSMSFRAIKNVMGQMLSMLKNLIFRGEGVEDVTGAIGVVSVMSQSVSSGLDSIINLIIIISFNLGIMNLLPIPALDGSRLVFLLVEGIRRKPIDREKEGMVHAIGLLILFGLMIVITYKDIVRLLK